MNTLQKRHLPSGSKYDRGGANALVAIGLCGRTGSGTIGCICCPPIGGYEKNDVVSADLDVAVCSSGSGDMVANVLMGGICNSGCCCSVCVG